MCFAREIMNWNLKLLTLLDATEKPYESVKPRNHSIKSLNNILPLPLGKSKTSSGVAPWTLLLLTLS